ncbi:MAG: hypothetical protein WB679_19415, partial [Terracidiphilus sp.]
MSRYAELVQEIERNNRHSWKGIFHSVLQFETGKREQTYARWAHSGAQDLLQKLFPPHSKKLPRVVVFSGVNHSSGCTGIAVAVAEALSKREGCVIGLAETNFRSPRLASVFRISDRSGLSAALSEEGPV